MLVIENEGIIYNGVDPVEGVKSHSIKIILPENIVRNHDTVIPSFAFPSTNVANTNH